MEVHATELARNLCWGRRRGRRPQRRAAGLASLVCLSAAALPALGDSSGRVDPSTPLTSTVTVKANRTSYAIVFLPRAVQGPHRATSLVKSWRGHASAVVLAPDRSDVFDPESPPPALVVPNLPGRTADPHPYMFIGQDPRHHASAMAYRWLPAGRYRLYIVTDGPTSVTLQLPGLSAGLTNVRPEIPGHARAISTYQSATLGTLPPAVSFGATGRLTSGKGLVWNVQWMHVPARVADAAGGCFYSGAPPSPAVYEVPSCALAGSGSNAAPDIVAEYIGYIPPPNYLTETEGYGYPRGLVGNQTYVAAAGPIQSEGAELLWLSW